MKIILMHLVLLLVLCVSLPYLFNVKYNENFATYPSNDTSFNEPMTNRDLSFNEPMTNRDSSFNEPMTNRDLSFNEPMTNRDLSFNEPMTNRGSSYTYSDYSETNNVNKWSSKPYSDSKNKCGSNFSTFS